MSTGGCAECARAERLVAYERQELAALRHAMTKRGNENRADLHDTWRQQKATLDRDVAALDAHQAECPIYNAPKAEKAPLRQKHTDERPRCPVCRKPTSVLPTGYLRRHNDKQGYPCSNVRPDMEAAS